MKIILGPGVNVTRKQVETNPVFKDWTTRLGSGWQGTVTVTDADFWDGAVHALQVTVTGVGDPWPSKLTLSSDTVDVLIIVTDGRQQYVVFVDQYRPAAGNRVISNVAGGCSPTESVLTAAAREVTEELGLDEAIPVSYDYLMPNPVLASPGLTNERVYLLKAELQLSPDQLERLRGRRTGVEAEGERIVTLVVPIEDARRFIMTLPDPDGTTLLSLGLASL